MMVFTLSRIDNNCLADELDQGVISLTLDNKSIASGKCMLYISITSLIDGVIELSKNNKKFEFIPTEASPFITLRKDQKNISIIHKNKIIHQTKISTIALAIKKSLEIFFSNPNNLPKKTGAIMLDLNDAHLSLENLITPTPTTISKEQI